jgi:hypothetical protein
LRFNNSDINNSSNNQLKTKLNETLQIIKNLRTNYKSINNNVKNKLNKVHQEVGNK